MRILLTGANGQLGFELQRVLIGEDLIPADQPDYELMDPALADKIAAVRPDLVIHAAAYTDVDGCERDPDTAFQVNALGTRRVAEGAAKTNARLVYISTDYVFDGKKDTPYTERDGVNPLTVYGRSKLMGEQEALKACPSALIVRTSWLYGVRGKNFVKTILQLAATRPEIRVVNDQKGSPTYARDLAGVIIALIRREADGVVHAGGEGECTWYELACAIIQEARYTCCVIPISTAESGRLAPRPRYSVLSTGLLGQHGLRLRPWQDALKEFIATQSERVNVAGNKRATIAAVVITKNEEVNIQACLDSLAWVDEMIVVDAQSADRTVELAKAYTPCVHVRPWPGYGPQKNFAMDQATADWVLIVDADERVTDELREEILAVLKEAGPTIAYRIPRRNYYYGRWIRGAGQYPDLQLRLLRRGCGQYNDLPVHEHLEVVGPIGDMKGHLNHHTHPTVLSHEMKIERYSMLAAEERIRSSKPEAEWYHLVFNPLWTFVKFYLLRRGYRDGLPGLTMSGFSAAHVLLKYVKLWERAHAPADLATPRPEGW